MAVFRQSALHLKKVRPTKFLCVKTARDKVVRHSLPIYAKMVRGGRPLKREDLAETNPLPSKTPISN